MSMTARLAGLAGAALLAVMVVAPARADVIIQDPGATGLRIGTVLKDSDKLVVATGTSVVVVLPSGNTKTVKGPYDGTVADITKNVALNQAAWNDWLKRLKQTESPTGGVGATRGVGR
jgi:hypothetical protein